MLSLATKKVSPFGPVTNCPGFDGCVLVPNCATLSMSVNRCGAWHAPV